MDQTELVTSEISTCVHILMESMHRHITNSAVVREGCLALTHLGTNPTGTHILAPLEITSKPFRIDYRVNRLEMTTHPTGKHILVTSGTIDLVSAIMRQHSANESVHVEALGKPPAQLSSTPI